MLHLNWRVVLINQSHYLLDFGADNQYTERLESMDSGLHRGLDLGLQLVGHSNGLFNLGPVSF